MLKCPLCSFTAETLQALKIHLHRSHKPNGECPVCGKRVKSLLRHLSAQSSRCEEHRLLYAIYADIKQCNNEASKNRIRELRDWAVTVLEVQP